jgi:hypothetical protein
MSYIIWYYVGIYAPLSPSLTTRLNGELLQHVKDERTSDEEKALRRRDVLASETKYSGDNSDGCFLISSGAIIVKNLVLRIS